jgi:hypothetical protein
MPRLMQWSWTNKARSRSCFRTAGRQRSNGSPFNHCWLLTLVQQVIAIFCMDFSSSVRVFDDSRKSVFGPVPAFNERDFNHPIAILYLIERSSYLVQWPKMPKALDLADRN